MTIKGLDELSRKLKALEGALAALDGEIGNVSFDPFDPQSIELAIQKVEAEVDRRVGGFGNDEMIQDLAEEAKESFREQILERASAARLAGGEAE